MVIRNSIKRDHTLLVITKKPTKMNTTKNTNSTMTSMKKANIRNTAIIINIIMKMRANIRREVIMKKVSKKAETKRRDIQKRDTLMKIIRGKINKKKSTLTLYLNISTYLDTNIRKDMNHITHIMRSMARKEENTEEVNMVSVQAMVMVVVMVITRNFAQIKSAAY